MTNKFPTPHLNALPESKIDFDKLTKAQRNTLGRIAIQEDTNLYAKRTIKVLLDKGLIVERKRTPPGRFAVEITMYEVPIPIHIQWCEWCSLQDCDL